MKLVWMTDIHLEFITAPYFVDIMKQVNDSQAEGLIITGDISNAHQLIGELKNLSRGADMLPIYFVLGNHDYYSGSFSTVHKNVRKLTKSFKNLKWLTTEGVIELTPSTCIIGHDGWYDGGYGNYSDSRVMLNDFYYINELVGIDKYARLRKFEELAMGAVNYLNYQVPIIAKTYKNIIFATHVPPFKEASVYENKQSDEYYLPYFSSKLVGDCLLNLMNTYPECNMTVLCGHTHGKVDVQVTKNLLVRVGEAEYREMFFEVIEI